MLINSVWNRGSLLDQIPPLLQWNVMMVKIVGSKALRGMPYKTIMWMCERKTKWGLGHECVRTVSSGIILKILFCSKSEHKQIKGHQIPCSNFLFLSAQLQGWASLCGRAVSMIWYGYVMQASCRTTFSLVCALFPMWATPILLYTGQSEHLALSLVWLKSLDSLSQLY